MAAKGEAPVPAQASPALVPSQVVRSREGDNVTAGEQQRRRPRRRGGKKNRGNNGGLAAASHKKKDGDGQQQQEQTKEEHQSDPDNSGPKNKRKNNRGKKKPPRDAVTLQQHESNTDNSSRGHDKKKSKSQASKKAWNRRENVKRKGKCPWKKHIPPGTVDPITLDPLVSLPYPPFALVATKPYVPVPEWPVAGQQHDSGKAKVQDNSQDMEEEEHRKRLEEQWGKDRLPSKVSDGNESEVPPEQSSPSGPSDRHYHLYDGRALAYYLVSQLQFIDPLNRRDLTREELVNLDSYLSRHGFGGDTKVVDAYDAKGITMSTAGTAGQSAAGRAQILQQEAQLLLNSLFGGGPTVAPPPSPVATAATGGGLRELYAASQNQAAPAMQHQPQRFEREDGGIHEADEDGGGGLIVIDDDANPGLRGAGFRSAAASSVDHADSSTLDIEASEYVPNTLWSARHIADRYSHEATVHRHEFPSLPAAESSIPSSTGNNDTQTTGNEASRKPPSRSLQRISNVVQKTDPAQIQRQREAREEALRRAMLANMSFVPPGSTSTGYDPSTMIHLGSLRPQQDVAVQPAPPAGPTEGQLERNRALASALGVAPATVRQQQNSYNSGWARPTDVNVELDQFGNELNAAQYPDSLILQARENVSELLRLEKRWKTFLSDDTAASLPLKPMLRPLRAFVHEYSDFWKLHTESFDREPKRYIHCVKMRDTSAPYPLLSEAARNWRGPGQLPPQPSFQPRIEHASQQTAGQSTVSRDFPPAPPREPLQLLPKSTSSEGTTALAGSATVAATADIQDEAQLNSRFDALFTGRERKKLELNPRTIPARLPPFQPQGNTSGTAEARLKEKAAERVQKEQEAEQQKRRVLEAAFASSDEEYQQDDASLSSGWEEEEQLYSSSSDNEDF